MCNKLKVLKHLYVTAKQRKKEKKDIIGMPCIQDKDGSLKLTSGEKNYSMERVFYLSLSFSCSGIIT